MEKFEKLKELIEKPPTMSNMMYITGCMRSPMVDRLVQKTPSVHCKLTKYLSEVAEMMKSRPSFDQIRQSEK